jgi:uncharacterized protein involved in response to NO
VTPAAAESAIPQPYRLLFPFGLLAALAGTLLWPLYAIHLIAWPGFLHRALMIEGFEGGFIAGFLLTALPGFTRGPRANRVELGIALTGLAVFVTGALTAAPSRAILGPPAFAHLGFTLTLALLAVAAARRLSAAARVPAEEFLLIGPGLLLGIAGGIVAAAQSGGHVPLLPFGFGLRMISHGTVLLLVLGIGSMLVPVFVGMKDPLSLPGIASAHERPGRRAFYVALLVFLLAALACEAAGRGAWAAWLRVLGATPALLLGWKLHRLPGVRDRFGFTLWSAGWLVLAGVWLAALVPSRPLLADHVLFVGGFGLLTLGISTRVVLGHGGYARTLEPRLLNFVSIGGIAMAAVCRLGAEFDARRLGLWLALAGALWAIGWSAWAVGALPRLFRPAPPVTTPVSLRV